MFVDTKYKTESKFSNKQTLQVTIRLPNHLVDEFILDFFVIINN